MRHEKPQAVSDLDEQLSIVSTFLKRFVEFQSPHQVIAVALWVAHTYAVEAAEATPYLGITAPEKRSGKTRLLEVLELLVARPWRAILPSEAVVFHKINADRATLLLDEVDAIFKDRGAKHEGLRAMLNAGYRRGAKIPRCLTKGGTTQDFDVFGPKAIAGIGDLPDTVADRSIPIRLVRRTPDENVERFRFREVVREATRLKKCLKKCARSNIKVFRAARPEIPAALNDRAEEVWEPLLAIADNAGGDWPRRARDAAVALQSDSVSPSESDGVVLLGAIRKIFNELDVDQVSTKTLIKGLVKRDDGPWPNLWEVSVHKSNIKGPGAHLARLLRPYGIKSKPIRFGEKVKKGYELEDFKDAFRRYLPRGPQEMMQVAAEKAAVTL